jgi:hypothetical protein
MTAGGTDHRSLRRVALGLDQAASTGWGIAAERGRVMRHGVARTHAQRREALELALRFAGGEPSALYVWFEKHDHMPVTRLTRFDHDTQRAGPRQGAPERSNATLIGMGKAYGRWLELCDLVGVPESHRCEVRPVTWRSIVHGTTRGTTEVIKRAAMDFASMAVGEPIADADHAEGICITAWASIHGFAVIDGEKSRARMDRRIAKELARQGTLALDALDAAALGGEPANDNGRRR